MNFGGIGIHIGIVGDVLTVIAPIEGTPAERVGIRGGDRIVEIEGKSTKGFTTEDAIKVLRGEPGTKVRIKIGRPGVSEPIPVEITREVINIKAVPYAGMIRKDIGYVRLADFSRVASRELARALDSLFEKGAKKIIFDLRSNGGGLLREGCEVADLFLSAGKVIVETKGRIPQSRRSYLAQTDDPHPDFPLIVLVDRGSASASEIVAGAIQDWERGVVLGDTTFGKGSVQNVEPLSADMAVRITTAYWYTPAGRCINRKRDENDEVVEDTNAAPALFHTLGRLQRTVYGGGAVAPDVYVPYEKLSEFEMKVNRDAYFDFAVDYVQKHPGVGMSFAATPAVLDEFADYLRNVKKMEFTAAEFDSARDWFAASIEREVASKVAGMRGDYEMRLRRDPQVKRAVELLESAGSNETMLSGLK
ncbi:MAG: S41 family peptidase [candidate division WOR-3 bacterium]